MPTPEPMDVEGASAGASVDVAGADGEGVWDAGGVVDVASGASADGAALLPPQARVAPTIAKNMRVMVVMRVVPLGIVVFSLL